MNWIKLKNIMLAFLIFMNVLLISIISLSTLIEENMPENAVDAGIKILSSDGFNCNRNVFPKTYKSIPSLTAKFYSATELSEIFFNKQLAFKTEGNSLIATSDNATLTVTDNHFVYETTDESTNASSLKLLKKLKKLGFDMQEAVYDDTNGRFIKQFNNLEVFNMYLEAKLNDDNEICYVSGYWPVITSVGENKHLSFSSHILKVKELFPEGGKITEIKLGYSIDNVRKEKYTFKPSWKITVDKETKILS